jgi:hypothetical protein
METFRISFGTLRNFTSKQIIVAIAKNKAESRKEWMLAIFKVRAEKNSHNVNYQFGGRITSPKNASVPVSLFKKLNYIPARPSSGHNNPVEAGVVDKA